MRAHTHVLAAARAAMLAFAVSLVAAGTAHAASPVLVASAGMALSPNGQPDGGGAAGGLGLMFPVEGPWSFGAVLFAEDLGTGLAELHDPNTGEALGTVADLHRWSFGGEWRAEARLYNARRARLLWGVGFGYGREEKDQRGQVAGAVSGITASTSASFLIPAAHGHAFGVALAVRRLFVSTESDPDLSTHWATAAVEWRWQGTPKD